MTKKTKTRKFAVKAKILSTKDNRIVENQKKREKEAKERQEALQEDEKVTLYSYRSSGSILGFRLLYV